MEIKALLRQKQWHDGHAQYFLLFLHLTLKKKKRGKKSQLIKFTLDRATVDL